MNDKLLRQVIGAVVILLVLAIVIRWFNSRSPTPEQAGATAVQQPEAATREYQVPPATDDNAAQQPETPATGAATTTAQTETPAAGAVSEQDSADKPAVENQQAGNPDAQADTQGSSRPVLAPGYSNTQPVKAAESGQASAPAAKAHTSDAAKPHSTVPAAAASASGDYQVQVASVSDKAAAEGLQQRLKKQGYPTQLAAATVKGKTYWRVQVGPYAKDTANQQAKALQALLKHPVLVVHK